MASAANFDDGNGNAVAVWWQSDSIASNTYTPSGGWGTAELIEASGFQAGDEPQVAMDGGGSAVAVWMQWDGVATSIMSNRYTPGVGWGTAEPIETGNGRARAPQVAMDGNGNAVAVWWQWDGVATSITSNQYRQGVGWGTAAFIPTSDDDDAGDATAPQVAMDPDGNAVAVWWQTGSIWSNRFE